MSKRNPLIHIHRGNKHPPTNANNCKRIPSISHRHNTKKTTLPWTIHIEFILIHNRHDKLQLTNMKNENETKRFTSWKLCLLLNDHSFSHPHTLICTTCPSKQTNESLETYKTKRQALQSRFQTQIIIYASCNCACICLTTWHRQRHARSCESAYPNYTPKPNYKTAYINRLTPYSKSLPYGPRRVISHVKPAMQWQSQTQYIPRIISP